MTEGTYQRELSAASIPAEPRAPTVRLAPRLRWRFLQAVTDFATVLASGLLTYVIYLASGLGESHYDPALYARLCGILAVVIVFAMRSYGAYRSQMGLLRIEDVRRVIRAVSMGLVLVLVCSFLLQTSDFSRATTVMLWPVIVIALVTQRSVLWAAQRKLAFMRRTARHVVIYGAGDAGKLLAQCLQEEVHLGLEPVGFLDDNPALAGNSVKVGPGVNGNHLPVLGQERDLDRVLRETSSSVVFLAMPSASCCRIEELVATLESHRTHYFFVPSSGDMLFSGLRFGQVAGMPIFTRIRPSDNLLSAILTQVISRVGAGIALLLTLPLLATAAVLVKLASPGPIFFTQARIGRNGRPFNIYKLRSMHVNTPKYATHPSLASDVRVFPIGRWLRRLSIDELPQLWNVLRGEMSLVGPRPEMPFIVEKYDAIQSQRLAVTPGVTGLWQISADRAFSIHDNMQYDLYYVENRSLSLDLAILLMTPFALMARNRAR